MRAEERDALIEGYFLEDMKLLRAKGNDYSGTVDCLKNLRRHGLRGIIVRLCDKMERLDNLVWSGTEGQGKEERALDTMRDARNYLFLAQIFLEGKDK